MRKNLTIRCQFIAALALLAFVGGCVVEKRKVELQGSTPAPPTPEVSRAKPTLAASPVEDGEGGWKVMSGDTVTLTVTAPGAKEVSLRYRPVVADEQDGYVELKKLSEPQEGETGKFQTVLRPPEDFAGEVWAEATYPDGERRRTEQVGLATRDATGVQVGSQTSTREPADAGANDQREANKSSAGEDDSARSDEVTGGRITRAALRPNRPDLRITVNVPAFLLTLWQDGKEVATYPVGVGRKSFPIPIGGREATSIILNPAWVPPDSSWVREGMVGERITADDPRNPLGKIKIPLGDAYLIHEAASPSDIGRLVSHGCVRMLTDDLFDLTERIARARSLEVTREVIEGARDDTERRVLGLKGPLPVDINYDTEVVEGGVLNVYPDVYERAKDRVERLRADLRAAGVDASKLDDATLKEMVGRASASEKFVVRLSDVGRGRALTAGRTEPLTEPDAKGKKGGRG
jgi:lipoprotein-anchoring transpeptidase ErfK/SrfK